MSWRVGKILLSSVIAAVIAGGGALIAALSELGADEDLGSVAGKTWVVVLVTLVVAGAKDLRTYLTVPPPGPPTP